MPGTNAELAVPKPAHELLRHMIATPAYRGKALRAPPQGDLAKLEVGFSIKLFAMIVFEDLVLANLALRQQLLALHAPRARR